MSSLPNTGTSHGLAWGSCPNHGANHPALHVVQVAVKALDHLFLAGSPLLRTFLQTRLLVGMAQEGLPRTGAGERGEWKTVPTRTAPLV